MNGGSGGWNKIFFFTKSLRLHHPLKFTFLQSYFLKFNWPCCCIKTHTKFFTFHFLESAIIKLVFFLQLQGWHPPIYVIFQPHILSKIYGSFIKICQNTPPALLGGWMAYPLPWGERVRVRGKWSNHHPHLNPPPSRGGTISWGIVPAYTELLEQETINSLMERLETFWEGLSRKGVDQKKLLGQSLLAPATCNLLNPDKEKTVEKAFEVLRDLSKAIREKYRLSY